MAYTHSKTQKPYLLLGDLEKSATYNTKDAIIELSDSIYNVPSETNGDATVG